MSVTAVGTGNSSYTEGFVKSLKIYENAEDPNLVQMTTAVAITLAVPVTDVAGGLSCSANATYGIPASLVEAGGRWVGVLSSDSPAKYDMKIQARQVVDAVKYFSAAAVSFLTIVVPISLAFPHVMVWIHDGLGLTDSQALAKVEGLRGHIQNFLEGAKGDIQYGWESTTSFAKLVVSGENTKLTAGVVAAVVIGGGLLAYMLSGGEASQSDDKEGGRLVNEKGQLINETGQLVNGNGHLVNEHGQLVNELGQLINETGHLVNANGQLINETGHLVNSAGQLINETGHLVNANGQLINETGHLVNADGHLVNEHGRLVNELGQLINENGHLVNGNGQLINEKGQLVNANGHLINEAGRLVNEHGQLVNEFGQRVDANEPLLKEDVKESVSMIGWKTITGVGLISTVAASYFGSIVYVARGQFGTLPVSMNYVNNQIAGGFPDLRGQIGL